MSRSSPVSVRLYFWLLAAATLLFCQAWCEASALTWGHGMAGGALWCLVGWLVLRALGRRCRSGLAQLSLGITLFLAHLLWDSLARTLWGLGSGIEYLLLAGLLNVGFFVLGQAERRLQQLILPLSLGVTVFGLTLSQGWLGSAYASLYLGGAILALLHRNGSLGSLSPRPRRPHPLPLLLLPILASFLGGIWLLSGQPTVPLPGFLTGSGGGSQSDPFGRGGVGNGEGEVAATQKTEDVGFANTDIVVESEKRTLFDAVNEFFGDELPPKKLSPMHRKASFLAREILEKPKGPQVAPHATKGFSLRRSQGKPAAQTKNEAARALLYVTGRAPLHLRLIAYEAFNGERWSEARQFRGIEQVKAIGGDWMKVSQRRLPPILGAEEYHEVKFGNLITDRIPTPIHSFQIRIDRLQSADFYRWAQEGIFCLDNIPQIPAGTKVAFRSHTQNPALFSRLPLTATPSASRSANYRLPEQLDPRIKTLAQRWTHGVPEGWPQVEAVIAQLRKHAHPVPAARPPATSDDPVAWFLFEGFQGPDYLFASAATVLLRSLGYPTRLVNGVYVSGKSKDPRTGQHVVTSHDLHFWIEVESDTTPEHEPVWVMFDPTPGYLCASPLPTLADSLRVGIEGAQRLMKRHFLSLVGSLTLALLLWRFRDLLYEVIVTVAWHLLAWLAPSRAFAWALWLLERRMTLTGQTRPAGATLQTHYRPALESSSPAEREALRSFLCLTEIRLYAPEMPLPTSAVSTARQMLRLWTRHRIKQLLGVRPKDTPSQNKP